MIRTSAALAVFAALVIAGCSSPENNRPAPSPSGTAPAAETAKPVAESTPLEDVAEEAAPAEGEMAAAEGEAAAPAGGEAAAAAEAAPAGDGPLLGAAVPAESYAEGKKIFETRCATCHGINGRGDGVGWSDPNKLPRNYHDLEWQKATSDERLERVITRGGAANGLDARMPAHADLRSQPEKLKSLIAYIRHFGDGKITE